MLRSRTVRGPDLSSVCDKCGDTGEDQHLHGFARIRPVHEHEAEVVGSDHLLIIFSFFV